MKMLEVCGTHDEGLHFKCTINHFFVMLWATFGGATASLTVFRSLTYIACCSPDFDQEFPVPGQFRSCGPVVGTLARGGSKMWGRRNSISVSCDRQVNGGHSQMAPACRLLALSLPPAATHCSNAAGAS